MGDLPPNFQFWSYSKTRPGVFGDGKDRLLREIARTGSLRAAAATLDISYRKAWSDVRKAETCLQTKLAIRTRGGAAGGRTVLTAQAESLLAAYQRFREEAERGIEKLFAETMEKWSC